MKLLPVFISKHSEMSLHGLKTSCCLHKPSPKASRTTNFRESSNSRGRHHDSNHVIETAGTQFKLMKTWTLCRMFERRPKLHEGILLSLGVLMA